MSTITKERAQQIFLGNGPEPTASEERELARISLASLEAEAVGEVVLGEYDDCGCHPDARVVCIAANGHADWENFKDGTRLYAAPPATVSVPDEVLKRLLPDAEKAEFWFEHDGKILFEGVKFNNAVFDACRAAMLQGAENAGSPTTMKTAPALDSSPKIAESPSCINQGKSEPVTKAYKLRDAVETIRNSGIEIDAEKIFAECDDLNAPDCWCRACRPITLTDMRFVVCPECGNKRCPHANDHRNACTGSNEPGQEGSAYPAAPQREAE
ncbi:hypothetical protein [Citrobacter amalonaticus]|uniref:hypothetical protein n=1 Tax=Citrobacter amalonaticus TaxID=35703 RepID=UPI001E32AF31|nr:hypothetical protein [Citrobacter amalonaticus]